MKEGKKTVELFRIPLILNVNTLDISMKSAGDYNFKSKKARCQTSN